MKIFIVKRTVLLGVTFLATALSNDVLAQACDELPNPQMGQVTKTNNGYYPSSATYSCDVGYDLVGTATRTCDTEGAWDGSAPACAPIVCDSLQAPDMGNVTLTNGGRYPSVANYSCDTGYALTGTETQSCATNGSWDGSAPACAPIVCDSLQAPDMGNVTLTNGGRYPSVANYSCDTGYALTGTATQFCTANGGWDDGSTPICEPIILSPTFVVSAYVKKDDIVPIRILGNADVNVRYIDKSSITLDGIHVAIKVKDNGRERFRCSFNYINDDEFEDLTCKFQTNIVACDEKVPAVLKGQLFNDGTYIEAAKFLENNTDICIDSSVE